MAKKNKKKNLPATTDGFENLLTGMGTYKDPLESTTFRRGKTITQNQELVTSLYSQNWLAGAVVDVPADDMTRNWITILDEEVTVEESIEKELSRLKAKQKINQALKWASAYGGALIIMMVDDGRDMEKPLTLAAVRTKGIKNLIVLDRHRGDRS